MGLDNRLRMAAVLALLLLAPAAVDADVAYIIRKPGGDRDVSVMFTYDREAEQEILKELKLEGNILLWQIQCTEKYVFYRPFHFSQGRMTLRPVLCLAKKYTSTTDQGIEGYVFQGYIFLDRDFDLDSPVNITLADKVLQARFR